MQKRIAGNPLALKVNGEEYQLLVQPQQTLLGVLRDDLGLTGTKLGCDDGTCGTCMVTVNGAMARACRVPIERVRGQASFDPQVIQVAFECCGEQHPWVSVAGP